MDTTPKTRFELSTWSIVKIILFILLLWFLFLIKHVLAILFVALIFAAALDPTVDWLERFKLPRGFSILVIYIVAFGLLSFVIYLLIPPIVEELSEISRSFPLIFEKLSSGFSNIQGGSPESVLVEEVQKNIGSVKSALEKATRGVLSALIGIFGGLISFFVVLVMTFYMTVEEEAMKRLIRSVVPERHQEYTMQLINRIQRKIGLWLRGQLILMVIIGVMTFIGLKILGIKYALVLALLAGIAEFIPFLGPVIAAVPAIFIGFTQSPFHAGGVIIMYFIIQQLENHIIVPKVMQKAVGLNPLLIIIVLLIGAKAGGVTGAILAVPVATAVSTIFKEKFEYIGHIETHETHDTAT